MMLSHWPPPSRPPIKVATSGDPSERRGASGRVSQMRMVPSSLADAAQLPSGEKGDPVDRTKVPLEGLQQLACCDAPQLQRLVEAS